MAKRCRCPKKTCAKRKGTRRFSDACRKEFRICMRGKLKETGSMKSAGTTCMPRLHQCARTRGRLRKGR